MVLADTSADERPKLVDTVVMQPELKLLVLTLLMPRRPVLRLLHNTIVHMLRLLHTTIVSKPLMPKLRLVPEQWLRVEQITSTAACS